MVLRLVEDSAFITKSYWSFCRFICQFYQAECRQFCTVTRKSLKQTKTMNLQNNQNSQHNPANKAQNDDQMDSSTGPVTSPAEPDTDDMELNEEQLDIISGGGDGLIRG